MATDHETPGFINACTTGFAVGKYQSGQLVTEMITADHCGKAGDVWHTGRNLDNPVVGTSQSAWSGGSDIRRIIGQSYGPVVYVGDWQSTAATGVKGAVLPILNGYVCYTGSSSGIHCGNKIISLNDSVCYGAFHCYIGQTRTTQVDGISAAGQGDSGGPVIAVANGYAYAIGIISGMQNADKESCVGRTDGRLCSSELWFAPVAQFLSNNTEYGILVYGGTS